MKTGMNKLLLFLLLFLSALCVLCGSNEVAQAAEFTADFENGKVSRALIDMSGSKD